MMCFEQRNMALDLLKKQGLPTKKIEKWHYTDLKNILPSDLLPPEPKSFLELPVVEDTAVILKNGALQSLPNISGIIFKKLANRQRELLPNDPIEQINTAYITAGADITIAQTLVTPLIINNVFATEQTHVGFNININPNTSATILEHHTAEVGNALATSISELLIAENAIVNYIILHNHPIFNIELQQFNARIKAGGQLNLYVINIGSCAKLRRQELNISILEENANFQLRSVNLLDKNAHNDIVMNVNHIAPNTQSKELLRNVVRDEAFGAFQGMIKVAQQAQKTDAKMSCNTLLLSDNASFSAKPELEIFADDVACGHGATIAPLNKDLLFYLNARGIKEEEARALLIKSFIQELITEDPQVEELVSTHIHSWTEKLASNDV
ncbi:MAG: Fe-S cluster assembly protein SufD [Alphaproteobacteria bacterium]|nr:Fe-S cluster assembly protein SufD [Alphaproteobacteria bacterium]